jgi:predicted transcriptional regulator
LEIQQPSSAGDIRMGPELTAHLSRRERQIMDVLFALGQGTVNDVLERIPEPPSYSAVRATLRTLVEKGEVEHVQDGPRYLYRPLVAKESARSAALGHLVRTFFGGSVEAAAAALLGMSRRKLTDADLRRLAEQVDSAREEGR